MILGLSFWKLVGAILTGLILSGVIIAMTIPHDVVTPKEEIKNVNSISFGELEPMMGFMLTTMPLLVIIFVVMFMLRVVFGTNWDRDEY